MLPPPSPRFPLIASTRPFADCPAYFVVHEISCTIHQHHPQLTHTLYHTHTSYQHKSHARLSPYHDRPHQERSHHQKAQEEMRPRHQQDQWQEDKQRRGSERYQDRDDSWKGRSTNAAPHRYYPAGQRPKEVSSNPHWEATSGILPSHIPLLEHTHCAMQCLFMHEHQEHRSKMHPC